MVQGGSAARGSGMAGEDADDTLSARGEFAVIDRLTAGRRQPPFVTLGPGDDAAVVLAPDGRVVVCTDMLVENRHFRLDWSSPHDVGRKAIAQNADPMPAGLNWDAWCGPSPMHPFKSYYLGGCLQWGRWLDYGDGHLADMGAHAHNLPLRALELGPPIRIAVTSAERTGVRLTASAREIEASPRTRPSGNMRASMWARSRS